MLLAACCLLRVACCLLLAVCCLFFIHCFLLSAFGSLISASCFLFSTFCLPLLLADACLSLLLCCCPSLHRTMSNKNVSHHTYLLTRQKKTLETLPKQAWTSKRGAQEVQKRPKIESGCPKEAPWELRDAPRCSKRPTNVPKRRSKRLYGRLKAPQEGLIGPPGGSKRPP